MNITYITASSYIDTVVPLVSEFTKENKIHLIVNLSHNTRNISFFNIKFNFNDNQILHLSFSQLGDIFEIIKNKNNLSVTLVYWKSLRTFNLKNILFLLKLKKLIKKNNIIHIDILSWHYLFTLFLNKNIFIDYHDPFEHFIKKEPLFLRFRKMLFNYLASGIIIHNSSDFEKFNKKYTKSKDKTYLSNFGTIPLKEISKFKEENTAEEFNILYFGRVQKYKGIEYLVEASKVLIKKYPNIKIFIAGAGEFYFDISDIKNIPNFVIKNRYIENIELAELINNCNIVVCPYVDVSQSGVVLTSYDFDKPIIASDIGAFKEYIIDKITGVLVPPKNVIALINAIEEFILNPEKIEEMSNNIKKVKNELFNWETVAEKLLIFYKNKINKT